MSQKICSFDGESVLRRVRVGDVHPSWQVFSPSFREYLGSFLPLILASILFMALLAIATDLFLAISHVENPASLWVAVAVGGSFFVCAFGLGIPLEWRHRKRCLLVLLPEGYVYGTTDPPHAVSFLHFTSAGMVKAKGRSLRLTRTMKHGAPLEKTPHFVHDFGGSFSPAVAQTIVEAYLDFKRKRLT